MILSAELPGSSAIRQKALYTRRPSVEPSFVVRIWPSVNKQMSSNVVEFPGPEGPEVRHASVHSPGTLLKGSRNEVWLCPAYTGSGEAMLYVKPKLTPRQVVSEVVASLAGQVLGLPCPQPYIVSVAPHLVGMPRGSGLTAFGSAQVGPRSLATPVRSLDVMLELLRKSKLIDAACVFDEWIANSVRGSGDLVFDPEGQVWLIDHEGALSAGLAPDRAETNWLAQRVLETLTLRQRAAVLNKWREASLPAHRSQLSRAPIELARVQRGVETYKELVQFLESRLAHLDALLSLRAVPEQGHIEQTKSEQPNHDADGTSNL
jgi:hypothetical protein